MATSGVTFFRTLGSSFGAAMFGTIYANVLSDTLPAAVAASPGVDPPRCATPTALHAYPADQIAPIVEAYAHAIHVVFLARRARGRSWLSCWRSSSRRSRCEVRREHGRRTSARASACPRARTRTQQLQIAIARLLQHKGRHPPAARA